MADEQDDLAKLSSLNKQVTELYQAGKFNEAIPIAQEFLELSEKALGPDHPDTATALNNLAVLYHSMGDYAKAEPLYQRALKIRRESARPRSPRHRHGPQQSGGAVSFHGRLRQSRTALSARAQDQTRKPSAPITQTPPRPSTIWRSCIVPWAITPKPNRSFSARSRSDEKALGPDHPDTATTLNNLAELYRSMGDYAKAEPLYQRALKIREKALGPDHPDTATALNNLAGLYRSMGDYAKAEPLYQRALKIREKALGPDHPDTATALNNLAALYRSMGDYAKAEPLYQRALKIRRESPRPRSPRHRHGPQQSGGAVWFHG